MDLLVSSSESLRHHKQQRPSSLGEELLLQLLMVVLHPYLLVRCLIAMCSPHTPALTATPIFRITIYIKHASMTVNRNCTCNYAENEIRLGEGI